jgi:hypothetical protein
MILTLSKRMISMKILKAKKRTYWGKVLEKDF